MPKHRPILLLFAFVVACSGSAPQHRGVSSAQSDREQEPGSQKNKKKSKQVETSSKKAEDKEHAEGKKKKRRKKRKRPRGQHKSASQSKTTGSPEGKSLQKRINKFAFRMHRVFSRYWVAPSLDDETLSGLRTVVHLRFDQQWKISSYRIKKSSRNEIFDDSVRLAVEALINHQEQQPEPPEDIRESISRFGMVMRVNGKDAVNDW